MDPSTDSKSPSPFSSRRALLAGALGGIGAWAAGAIGRVGPVRAANGDPITIGASNSGTSGTTLTNTTDGANALSVASTGAGFALMGGSDTGFGVFGQSADGDGVGGDSTTGRGVVGSSTSGNGVYGSSSAPDRAAIEAHSAGGTGLLGASGLVPAAKPETGVYGYAIQSSISRGVWGYSAKGHGVHGESRIGAAVFGKSKHGGFALLTRGRIKAERVSGVASLAAGNTTVTLSPGVKVVAGSFVLLTPRANIGSRGLWYTTNPAADTITIHLSSSRPSPTPIAWLMLG